MTNLITATANGTDISSRIQKAIVTRKATEGIGTYTLLLNNNDNGLVQSSFPVNAAISISLAPDFGGTAYHFFNGYLDVPDFIQTQDQKSKSIQVAQLTGRDLGQDLQNKTIWGSDNGHIEALIANFLTYGVSGILAGNTAQISSNSPSNPYTEIGYTLPNPLISTSTIFWDSQGRTFISDNIKRLLNLANWDGYVDLNKQWQMFPVGTISSGINLWDLPDNSQNNVIGPVHIKPVSGTELRNIITVYGGFNVNDSWTDWGTAQYWFAATNAASVTDYASTDIWQQPQAGASVLKITAKTTLDNTNTSIMWGMNFPSLFHWYLPFNQVNLSTVKFSIWVHNAAGTPENQDQTWSLSDPKFITPSLSLTDNLGNKIHYQWGGNYRFNKWLNFECNVGYQITTEAQIYDWSGNHGPTPSFGDAGWDKWVYDSFTGQGTSFPSSPTTGQYFIYLGLLQTQGVYYWNGSCWILFAAGLTGNTGFNWKVVNITFLSGGESGALPSGIGIHVTRIDYILFDNLVFPQVQVMAVADHSGYTDRDRYGAGLGNCPVCGRHFSPSSYGQRQLPITRTNLNYQTDVSNYAETVCNQRMTPLSTVSLRCDGRAGLVSGAWQWYPGKTISLNGAESYRMIEITHTIERNVDGSGFSHIVDLSLVPKFLQLDMEQWTYSAHGDVGVARQLHDRVQALENTYQLLNPTT